MTKLTLPFYCVHCVCSPFHEEPAGMNNRLHNLCGCDTNPGFYFAKILSVSH